MNDFRVLSNIFLNKDDIIELEGESITLKAKNSESTLTITKDDIEFNTIFKLVMNIHSHDKTESEDDVLRYMTVQVDVYTTRNKLKRIESLLREEINKIINGED